MAIEIPLTRGMVAIIDDEDFEIVSWYKWHAKTDGWNWYAHTNVRREDGSRTMIRMHRLILGLTDPKVEVDHIDGNGLNNTRSNLRACNRRENMRNTRAYANNKSGLKGVHWREDCGKWRACIRVNGKLKNLGCHDTKEAAYEAYCKAAIDLHGEFANTGTISQEIIT